ncbi:MAG: hypothetical protein QNJ65_20170 [Xenococcaceae cyanobacterium MO_234.B1]|nr:hypothetical protein [Xenococcaceae cyanobacterium MO_234.B1]
MLNYCGSVVLMAGREIASYDGSVIISITAIVAASVTILGIVAILMTMLANADTKTKVNVDPKKPSISMELEKSQLSKKQDGCLLAQNNRLIGDNK